MKELKRILWFTKASWSYMQGQRMRMVTDFLPAYRSFRNSSIEDEQATAALSPQPQPKLAEGTDASDNL